MVWYEIYSFAVSGHKSSLFGHKGRPLAPLWGAEGARTEGARNLGRRGCIYYEIAHPRHTTKRTGRADDGA